MFIGKRILNKELKKSGIPVYSANVFSIFGYTDNKLLKDFSKESVIWGIDGDWNVNVLPKDYEFYPTDHCGVLRLKQDNIVEPKYLVWLLKNEGEKARFSRSYRASIDRISQLSVIVPDYKKQQKIVKQVYEIEKIIQQLESSLSNIEKQKANIISKFL